MCKKDYAAMLAEKVQTEYDDFIAEMMSKSADEIIQSAYQIVTKDEIALFCRECSPKLEEKQFEALLSSRNTLHEIFEQWCKLEELHGLEDIVVAIEETADRILGSMERINIEINP